MRSARDVNREYLPLEIPEHDVVHIIEVQHTPMGRGGIPMCPMSNLAAWSYNHVKNAATPTCLACIAKVRREEGGR